jgi:DNA-binding MarR family transcriptional regulator
MKTGARDVQAREAYLNVVRAHEKLHGEFSALFRAHGLTAAQYNVLRILIGGPEEGASCHYVGERLLNRLPDVTRLLDRMEKADLVERRRSENDRRVVLVRITRVGRERCEGLAEPVTELHRRQVAHLPAKALVALNEGLQGLLDGQEA